MHQGTYTAVVDRAGIDNTPKGQWEAAKACNLTARQTWQHTIVLRAVPSMIPALANHFIALFKETPLLSAITILEPMNKARSVANFHYRRLETMALGGALSLVISISSVILLSRLERRFGGRAGARG